MSIQGGSVWHQLPEDFREKLETAARRARKAAPLMRETLDGESLPPCDEITTPHGPALLRSLEIEPGRTGFEETFRKLLEMEALLARGTGIDPHLDVLVSLGLRKALFLDLETTGFSSTPLFLAGTMTVENGRFVIRQFFAKDYSQEKSVLDLVSEVLDPYDILITFNGKAYDVPFLRDRFCFHDLPFRCPAHHLDLLHAARRRWRDDLPNCRLVTLEQHLCGRRRFGDIPGSEIPTVYHEFVKRGYSHAMKDVFHHNVLDLVTLAEILAELTLAG